MEEKNISPLEKNQETTISLASKKEVSVWHAEKNPLLKHAQILEKSPLFEQKFLQKWEVLFDEWSIDNKLYIIKKGLLSVEKYTTNEKKYTKQLAILKNGDFVGENGMNLEAKPKEAKIICIEDAELLQIDLKNDLKKFIEENPSIGFEILKHVIVETNKRLSEINKLFASNYELEKTINALKIIDIKAIFMVLEKIQSILDVDYILFFEKHAIMDHLLTLRYDSRFPGKMQDKIFEKQWPFIDLDTLCEEANISKDDQIIINKLSLWDEIYGYIILWREKRSFDGSDKKILSWASNSLAGIVKKYLWDKEEKNKLYISEMKK